MDKNGGFYLSDTGNTELFMNPKETYDGAIPSGNSVMAYNLVRLQRITGKKKYKELMEKQMFFMSANAGRYPTGNSMFLISLLLSEDCIPHITIAPSENEDLSRIAEKIPFMANVSVAKENSNYPLLNNKTTFYVCKNRSCFPPTNDMDSFG